MAERSISQQGTPQSGDSSPGGLSLLRVFWAVVVGMLGAIFIWIVTPYNNFIIGNGYISDSFLPVAALFFLLAIVWLVNPILRVAARRIALNFRQLAIVLGIMLMASVLPGQGLLRMLPGSLANLPRQVRVDKRLAEAYEQMGLPESLFPEKLQYGEETPVGDYLVGTLPPGENLPWGAWIKPLLSWGTLLFFIWLMVVGLGLVVFPQWRRNERLPFPLITLQQALIEDPENRGFMAPLFRNRVFWIATLAVFVLHGLHGWSLYNPEGVPAIPLNWSLASLFTEEPLIYLPGHFHTSRIYFIFLGVAFFMPSRIGFSIWFFTIAYCAYRVIGAAYFPPYQQETVSDHRVGAMLAMTIGILWLGRFHWAHVARCMVSRAREEADTRDGRAGWMFLIGAVGMGAWLVWIGVPVLWALYLVGVGFMLSILVARIVAETGIPFFRIDVGARLTFLKVFPHAWLSPVVLFSGQLIALFFAIASRVSPIVMSTHAVGMDDKASPRHQMRTSYMAVAVLMVGLVICGAAHLVYQYNHGSTLDGLKMPVAAWGTTQLNHVHRDLLQMLDGNVNMPSHNPYLHMGFGAALAGFLQWMCLMSPKWPLHPIGLLMVFTFYGNEAWVAVLLGWLLKTLILRYGGARLYRAAIPAFIGMVVGEIVATAFWSLIPAILAMRGLPYTVVMMQPM